MAEFIEQNIIDPVEGVLANFGLMSGPGAIPKRFLLGMAVGATIMALLKPDIAFVNGVPRPWSFISDDPEATMSPWWMGAVVGGLAMGMLI